MTTQIQPFNLESKSLLAKLLASENITIEINPSTRTAAFDVKNRVLILPLWQNVSEDLHDMLVVHETGHAIDTPADGWENQMRSMAQKYHGKDTGIYLMAIKTFLNVIEDARIDKRQKRRFPGSRKNYLAAYKELMERDFFGIANKDINTLPFIDRANLYYKGGNLLLNIKFTPEERRFLSRMGDTETWEQVVALTDEIYGWAKSKGEETKSQLPDDMLDMDSSEYGTGDQDYELSDDGDASDDNTETDGKGDTESESDDDSETDSDSDGNGDDDADDDSDTDDFYDQSNNAGSSLNDKEYVPQSETDKAWEQNKEKLLANSDHTFQYFTVPEVNHDVVVDNYKKVLADYDATLAYQSNDWLKIVTNNLNKFKSTENATISYMVKEFESKKAADIYSRAAISKTGVIDTNKLHSYKYNEDLFRKLSILPQGKNHGFVMFLDWSGSMNTNLQYTIKQLMSLTLFCKRVQIPFEVYLFRELCYKDLTGLQTCQAFKDDPKALKMSNFKLRNIMSSKMSLTELNKAYLCLWAKVNHYFYGNDPMGGTPLNQAIVAAEKIINDFRAKNKLQVVNTIFLTDGQSDPVENFYSSMYPTTKKTNIIQDTKTKKQYTIPAGWSGPTTVLLKILKERTGANILGFFLYDSSFKNMLFRFFPSTVGQQLEKVKQSWNENNFVPVYSEGYDEYYIINTKKAKTATAQKLEIDSNMTKGKMAREFIKFSEKKSVNRILLNNFINQVTKVA